MCETSVVLYCKRKRFGILLQKQVEFTKSNFYGMEICCIANGSLACHSSNIKSNYGFHFPLNSMLLWAKQNLHFKHLI